MKFTKENVLEVLSQWYGEYGSIEDIDKLNKRFEEFDDTPEKVIIPQYVANRIEKYEAEDKYERLEFFIQDYQENAHSIAVDACYEEDKMTIINAILNGYEVEKEPLYEVKVAEQYLIKKSVDRTDHCLAWPEELKVWDKSAYQLTEHVIKSIDERFWPFAVKVGRWESDEVNAG